METETFDALAQLMSLSKSVNDVECALRKIVLNPLAQGELAESTKEVAKKFAAIRKILMDWSGELMSTTSEDVVQEEEEA